MGTVWHWSQPPGGGIDCQDLNIVQPTRSVIIQLRTINDNTFINNSLTCVKAGFKAVVRKSYHKE
jgi:hypothetical protein